MTDTKLKLAHSLLLSDLLRLAMQDDLGTRLGRDDLNLDHRSCSSLALRLETLEHCLLCTPPASEGCPEVGCRATVGELSRGEVASEERLVRVRDGGDELDVRADAVDGRRRVLDKFGRDRGVARGRRRGGGGEVLGEGEGAVRVGGGAREGVEEDVRVHLRDPRSVLLDLNEVTLGEELWNKDRSILSRGEGGEGDVPR